MVSQGYDEEEDVLFNFHKIKRTMVKANIEMVSLYTKWHISEGLHVLDADDDKIKYKVLDLDNTPAFKDFNRNRRLQSKLTMNMNKFIGQFQIPVYNKLKHYNFYDTLDAFIKLVFSEDHKRMFNERQERIEHTIKAGEELPPFDTICEGSRQFDDLSLSDQELWLEVNDENFQPVINRMEHKGLTADDNILKLSEMRRLRRKRGKQHRAAIDIYGKNVIDSSVIRGAQAILRFVEARQEGRKQRRVSSMMTAIGSKVRQDVRTELRNTAEQEQKSEEEFMKEVERDLSSLVSLEAKAAKRKREGQLELNVAPQTSPQLKIAPHAPVNMSEGEGTRQHSPEREPAQRPSPVDAKKEQRGSMAKGEFSLPISAQGSDANRS